MEKGMGVRERGQDKKRKLTIVFTQQNLLGLYCLSAAKTPDELHKASHAPSNAFGF